MDPRGEQGCEISLPASFDPVEPDPLGYFLGASDVARSETGVEDGELLLRSGGVVRYGGSSVGLIWDCYVSGKGRRKGRERRDRVERRASTAKR